MLPLEDCILLIAITPYTLPGSSLQVVCRILQTVSPLPPAQSSDYLILKNNGSDDQVCEEELCPDLTEVFIALSN